MHEKSLYIKHLSRPRYGSTDFSRLKPSVDELYTAISETFQRGGNVIIPTFALERAQEIPYFLSRGVSAGRLPGSMQLFLDSPMAISATHIFERHIDCYNTKTAELFREEGKDPFQLPGLHFTCEAAESMALNQINGGAVIMAGSGICTGGQAHHHLKHNLWRRGSSIIFPGYAARGTLARRIVDGTKQVHIFGEEIPVHAAIHTINGFSAHTDQPELLAWHNKISEVNRTFLVHGKEESMRSFASRLHNTEITLPVLNESFEL